MLYLIILLLGKIYAQKLEYPISTFRPLVYQAAGISISDPYAWLEAKESAETVEWSKQQHKFTLSWLNENGAKINGLNHELKTIIDRDYKGPIQFYGNRKFFFAQKSGEPQRKLYTIIEDREILLFDPAILDPTGNSAITYTVFSKSGDKVAIGVQTKGNEISDCYIYNTLTGEQLGKPIPSANSFRWANDENYAFIVRRTLEMIKKQLPLPVYKHKIGTDYIQDEFITQPNDAKDFASVFEFEDCPYTFLSTGDFYTTTLKIRPIGSSGEWRAIYSSDKHSVTPLAKNGKLYFFTNDKAPLFKLMVANYDSLEAMHWEDFLPESNEKLENFVVTNEFVIAHYKSELQSVLKAYDVNTRAPREVALPENGVVSSLTYHKESNKVFVGLNTFTTPAKVYVLDGKSLAWNLHYEDKSPVDLSDVESKLEYYTSKDGTRVPIYIIHKKGVKRDGTNPTLLYGYGGFNVGMSPSYISTMAPFVKRGGVYAIACLRGGNEYGENWHQAGMRDKKQNVFDDFIAAAEFLVSTNYTSHHLLALRGGSNGGLLIGAVTTQRPDICKAAICAVPLLDMLRFHKFLIARYWIPEYGDPDNHNDARFILRYSPYHNIRMGVNLPSMMVIAGENDTRVDPLHAKKFVAALQNNFGQINPILLYMDYDSGHGPGKSTAKTIETAEVQLSFIMNQLNMK
jgi:prolyl oligopeptidase